MGDVVGRIGWRRPLAPTLFVVMLLAGCAQAETSISKGSAIATERCSRCHAVTLDDQSAHAQAPPFRALAARYPIESLAEALAEGILTGHPDMPQFEFSGPEVGQFLDYLADLNERAGTKPKTP